MVGVVLLLHEPHTQIIEAKSSFISATVFPPPPQDDGIPNLPLQTAGCLLFLSFGLVRPPVRRRGPVCSVREVVFVCGLNTHTHTHASRSNLSAKLILLLFLCAVPTSHTIHSAWADVDSHPSQGGKWSFLNSFLLQGIHWNEHKTYFWLYF